MACKYSTVSISLISISQILISNLLRLVSNITEKRDFGENSQINTPFLYPLKTLENRTVFDVLGGREWVHWEQMRYVKTELKATAYSLKLD